MNYGMIFYVLGWLLNFEAAFMLPPAAVAVIYREKEGIYILITMILCLIPGLLEVSLKPKKRRIYSREGFVITALSWFVLSLFGALPFRISGYIPHMVDAVFETASGFTTTGASILTNVEALPHCLLFWRSFTHWMGGMGVLVFIIAILPMAGGSDMYLMKAESPGPDVQKLVPKVKTTASTLYGLYIVLTVLQVIFMLLGRMPLFDALTTAFGTAGTGGFGIKNNSIAGYSTYLQVVITIFMILFGINFNVYYLIYKNRIKDALHVSEMWTYLGIIAAAIILICFNILPGYANPLIALRDAAFQVGSIITTTGFSTVDFDLWPAFSKTILVTLMFIGACAGSTGGGLKVSRVQMLAKSIPREIGHVTHPNSVRKIKIDGKQVEHSVMRSVNVYIAAYIIIFACSVLLISLDNFDLTTNFTAVAATLNNIGPGLAGVGPTANFSQYSYLSKVVLTFDMIAGRLELFPVLILFSWKTWIK